jgi:hypothetical protein
MWPLPGSVLSTSVRSEVVAGSPRFGAVLPDTPVLLSDVEAAGPVVGDAAFEVVLEVPVLVGIGDRPGRDVDRAHDPSGDLPAVVAELDLLHAAAGVHAEGVVPAGVGAAVHAESVAGRHADDPAGGHVGQRAAAPVDGEERHVPVAGAAAGHADEVDGRAAQGKARAQVDVVRAGRGDALEPLPRQVVDLDG